MALPPKKGRSMRPFFGLMNRETGNAGHKKSPHPCELIFTGLNKTVLGAGEETRTLTT